MSPKRSRTLAPSERPLDHWKRQLFTSLPKVPRAESNYRGYVYDVAEAVYWLEKKFYNELLSWITEEFKMKYSEWLDEKFGPIEDMVGDRGTIFAAIEHGVSKAVYVSYGAANAIANKRRGQARKASGEASAIIVPSLPDKTFSEQERSARYRGVIDAQKLIIGKLRLEVSSLSEVLREMTKDQKEKAREYEQRIRQVEKHA